MKNKIYSPVPINQIPTEEYIELKKSWFFSLPLNNKSNLHKSLIIAWLLSVPFIALIARESLIYNNNYISIIITSLFSSLLTPTLLLIRQLLGWDYILKRLTSEKIEYEETGWYDGQTWEKPLEWREKDLLIAQHEINPIINSLKNLILFFSKLMLILTIILLFLIFFGKA